MGRAELLTIAFLYTVGCDRGSRAHAPPPDPLTSARDSASAPLASAGPDARARAKLTCTPDPQFPGVFDLPEASAAAEVELRPGERELLIVSDSGHHGAALARGIPSGPLRALTLPLDPKVSDDVEGIAWRGRHLYAIVSVGFVQRFSPDGKGGLVRDGDAYPIGPEAYMCHARDLDDANCGMNYEGLCLHDAESNERCAGYVASKTEGWLGCVVFRGERLALDLVKPKLALGLPRRSLSDCAFGAAGGPAAHALLVTTNIFGGSTSYLVHEGTGALTPIEVTGLPTNEAVAVDRDGALYQLMDANTDTSPALRATCTGW
jgi:hypothetical protein